MLRNNQIKYTASLVLLLILIVFIIWLNIRPSKLGFGNLSLDIETATNRAELIQGLSGRSNLEIDRGMLFVFNQSGYHCIWMKDMNFPIDILWLDETQKVVDIKRDVSPASYPETFCPDKPARYVLEVNAGLSQKSGVDVGAQL
jgi:uncharacterized membrane protein (UPF0127 family)